MIYIEVKKAPEEIYSGLITQRSGEVFFSFYLIFFLFSKISWGYHLLFRMQAERIYKTTKKRRGKF